MRTKILIVDDLKENILALSELIRTDDVEILAAENADQALDLLIDHEFALALLDVQMPTMSGFELARLIRGVERSRHLPIIFVTAEQREQAVIFEGYDTGAVDVLFKPLDPHIVRSKVRVFVKLDQQSRQLRAHVDLLSQLKQEAESANVAKSQFLANMSHEIRTPLSAVLGFSDVLSQPDLSAEEKIESIGSITRNGQLLLRIIDDILDLSRIEAQQLELEYLRFDLGGLISDLKSTLSARAIEKGITLEFDYGNTANGVIDSDPLRIKQILINVIGNAIKFTSKGGVVVTAAVNPKAENDLQEVKFTVADTGLGLTPNDVKRIFEPFAQADTTTRRRFGGTGLGLAISRRLAQSLGGDVHVIKSEKGKGSIFEITLRASYTKISPSAKDTAVSVALKPYETEHLSGKKILVVDDVQDNRILIERYLRSTGMQIGLAAGGQEAIDQVEHENWDVILMDIQMPKMDGYETTDALRKSGFSNPIIALTAHAMREELDRCMRAGFDLTLTKPIGRRELIQSLAAVLM